MAAPAPTAVLFDSVGGPHSPYAQPIDFRTANRPLVPSTIKPFACYFPIYRYAEQWISHVVNMASLFTQDPLRSWANVWMDNDISPIAKAIFGDAGDLFAL